MSDQREVGSSTSLEEVFLSREFGSRDFARAAPRPVAFDVIGEVANPAAPAELEEIFLSARFGRLRAFPPPLHEPSDEDLVASDDGNAEIVVLRPWDGTRHRAIAAVSGIAAAALVVAGVASGGGHPGHQDVAAQGQRAHSLSQQGATTPTGSTPTSPVTGTRTPTVATVASASTDGEAPGTTVVVAGPTGLVIVGVPPGTRVIVVPSSTSADSDSTGTSGSGGGSSSPAPTPPTPPTVTSSGSPLAPAVVAVSNVVTGVGTTVTSTLGQVTSTVPSVSPVAGMLGGVDATISGLGQALGQTAA